VKKVIPVQALGFPDVGSQIARPHKVVRLALRTDCLYGQRNVPATHSCYRLRQQQDHGAAGRIMSEKNFSNTIGNLIRHLLACTTATTTMFQPNAPSGKEGK
jgi:hypothetical protein